jgi:hypothetical protein
MSLTNQITDLYETVSLTNISYSKTPSSFQKDSNSSNKNDFLSDNIFEESEIHDYKKDYNNLMTKYNYLLNQYIQLKKNFKEISSILLLENTNTKLMISSLKNQIEEVNKNFTKNEKLIYLDIVDANNNKNNFYNNDSDEQNIKITLLSIDKKIHLPIFCKNTEKFSEIESVLYEKFPKYKKKENTFIIKDGKKVIQKSKTLKQNKIENDEIIYVYST